jgi:hypothetical protein
VGIKTAGVGHFTIPTAPAAGTSCTSGAANTFTTTYVVLSAAAPAAIFITGIHLEAAAAKAATYIVVQLATGGAGSEAVVGQYLVPLSTASTVALGYRQIYPPIPVANGVRIACKTADSVGAAATLVTLECINQSNVVDDGVAVGSVAGAVGSVTGNVGGNVVGSVGSVVGSVGSVVGSVGSVVGSVGSVAGAVASVTAGVTVTTNNDKTGYALSAAAVQAVWDALTSALTTVGSIGKLIVTNLDALISSRMATYTQPTGFLAATFPAGTIANTTNITAGTITTTTNLTNAPTVGDLTAAMKASVTTAATASTPTAAAVTGAVGSVTAAVTLPTIPANWISAAGIAATALNGKGDWSTYAGGDTSGTTTLLARLTALRAAAIDNVDATISSRLASASYTAPDNASVAAIKTKTDSLTFTVPAKLDVNVLVVNGITLIGNGTTTPMHA